MLLSAFGSLLQLLYLGMLVLAVVAFVFAATARRTPTGPPTRRRSPSG
ncbi:hypothetical protein SCYAM73S_06558 [Streptomyces cyaneofuscatus]